MWGGVGIDTTSLSSINGANKSYTATEDCYAIGYMSVASTSVMCWVKIDNTIEIDGTGQGVSHPLCFPLKKGQTVTTRNETGQAYSLTFYKLKY